MKKEKIYGLTLSFPTGYTGEGGNFGWIIPTPVPPAIEDVSEAGENGEPSLSTFCAATDLPPGLCRKTSRKRNRQ